MSKLPQGIPKLPHRIKIIATGNPQNYHRESQKLPQGFKKNCHRESLKLSQGIPKTITGNPKKMPQGI